MRRAAWLGALSVALVPTIWPLTSAGRFLRVRPMTAHAPASDLPRRPGHRAVWASDTPSASQLRDDDRVVELVTRDPLSVDPFFRRVREAYPRLERASQRLDLILVVTVTGLEAGPWRSTTQPSLGTIPPGIETRRVFARVDQVLKNRSAQVILPGAGIAFGYEGGGQVTIGRTLVTTRHESERLPQRGRRYLWFMGATKTAIFGGTAANAFDITGRRVMPLLQDGDSARLRRMTPTAVLERVRLVATLPRDYESACNPPSGRWIVDRVIYRP